MFGYTRGEQPRPQLGAFAERLDAMLAVDAARPRRDRLTLRRMADLVRQEGYAGGCDAVRRHARQWQAAHQPASGGQAFVPLVFPPGGACQFDWLHEHVVLGGVTALVKVATCGCATAGRSTCGPTRARRMRNVLEAFNAWLEAQCLRWAAQRRHPERRDRTLADVLEAERPAPVSFADITPWDRFALVPLGAPLRAPLGAPLGASGR